MFYLTRKKKKKSNGLNWIALAGSTRKKIKIKNNFKRQRFSSK
jgi:hypothetical protein